MNKFDFFIKGMQEGKYKDKRWVLRAFSLVRETKTLADLGPWDILQSSAGFSYVEPTAVALAPITGELKAGEPMFTAGESILVKKGTIPGFMKDEETTVGRLLYHCIVFVYPFGNKVPFENALLNMGRFEDDLAKRLEDDVLITTTDGIAAYEEKQDCFYPRELIKYYEAVAYSRSLAMLFVPAASPKTLGIDPAVLKRRDEIFNDPKIDMDDQATAAAVDTELSRMDKETFKNDTASGFLINKKDFDIIRKKRFISSGSGSGLTPGSKTRYIKRSLNEGLDVAHFKDYNDEMRGGSYKRGVETMFGGELDKWLVRQSSNLRVIMQDCGTTIGMPETINEFNQADMLGHHIVSGKGYITLDENNIGTYLGKEVLRRTPAACWGKAPDYCNVCLGEKLSMNPDALSIAFSQYGHAFMGESMSAMHGKALTVALMDFVAEAS